MFKSGFIESVTYNSNTFVPVEVSTIPDKYDLRRELSAPIDQGESSICVSVCATDMVSYAFKKANKKYKKKVDFFYKHRPALFVDGMSPRDAFDIACKYELITSYAMVRTAKAARVSIVANGPAMIALPVYNLENEFWKASTAGSSLQGYHAVTLVGFDDEDESFTLRNSWGTDWGSQGYVQFPYSDFDKVLEAWTLFR